MQSGEQEGKVGGRVEEDLEKSIEEGRDLDTVEWRKSPEIQLRPWSNVEDKAKSSVKGRTRKGQVRGHDRSKVGQKAGHRARQRAGQEESHGMMNGLAEGWVKGTARVRTRR